MPLKRDESLRIEPASARWREEFSRLAAALRESLDLHVEHVGSTAVPGLDARPILDIVVVAGDDAGRTRCKRRLHEMGYADLFDGAAVLPDVVTPTSKDIPRVGAELWMEHRLYLTTAGSEDLRNHRTFRDFLVEHPRAAEAYARLKQSLSIEYDGDPAGYQEKKTIYVMQVIAAAQTGATPDPVRSIGFQDFQQVDIRVGTVVAVKPLPRARTPAWVLEIDFGELGILTSSARLTELYAAGDLLGEQVLAAVNLGEKQVGSVRSQCLVLGVDTPAGTVRVRSDRVAPNGSRVY